MRFQFMWTKVLALFLIGLVKISWAFATGTTTTTSSSGSRRRKNTTQEFNNYYCHPNKCSRSRVASPQLQLLAASRIQQPTRRKKKKNPQQNEEDLARTVVPPSSSFSNFWYAETKVDYNSKETTSPFDQEHWSENRSLCNGEEARFTLPPCAYTTLQQHRPWNDDDNNNIRKVAPSLRSAPVKDSCRIALELEMPQQDDSYSVMTKSTLQDIEEGFNTFTASSVQSSSHTYMLSNFYGKFRQDHPHFVSESCHLILPCRIPTFCESTTTSQGLRSILRSFVLQHVANLEGHKSTMCSHSVLDTVQLSYRASSHSNRQPQNNHPVEFLYHTEAIHILKELQEEGYIRSMGHEYERANVNDDPADLTWLKEVEQWMDYWHWQGDIRNRRVRPLKGAWTARFDNSIVIPWKDLSYMSNKYGEPITSIALRWYFQSQKLERVCLKRNPNIKAYSDLRRTFGFVLESEDVEELNHLILGQTSDDSS